MEQTGAALDELNMLYARAATKLKALKTPNEVWVEFTVDDEKAVHHLGLTKINNQWQLAHKRGDIPPAVLTERVAEIRVAAVPAVRRLHEAIIVEKEKYIEVVDAAIKDLVQYHEQFGSQPYTEE